MTTVRQWTGYEAKILRLSRRMSVRGFAEHLGVNPGAVTNWERRGRNTRLRYETQEILDTDLARSSTEVQKRFAAALMDEDTAQTDGIAGQYQRAGQQVVRNYGTGEARIAELGEHSSARTRVLAAAISSTQWSHMPYLEPADSSTALEDFLKSPSRVFVVKGLGGSGKTRLLHHFVNTTAGVDFQLISAAECTETASSLESIILRYASIASGADPSLLLERASSLLRRPLIVAIDGSSTRESVLSVCRQVDSILRQVLSDNLRFLIVFRTPPDVELSRYPVLAAAVMERHIENRGTSFSLASWDSAAAREAWSAGRDPHQPPFDSLPEPIRDLVRLPLYMNLVKAAGSEAPLGHTNAYRLIDYCVRAIISAAGEDTAPVLAQLGLLAQRELIQAVPTPLKALSPGATPTALPSSLDLPLLQSTPSGRTFAHDAIREYFFATWVAQAIEARGRSSVTVETLNEMAARTASSPDLHGILGLVLQCLDVTAPYLLAVIAQSPTTSSTVTLPAMLQLTGRQAAFTSPTVLRTCAARCLQDNGRNLTAALLHLPALAESLEAEHTSWLLKVIRRFGSDIWSDVVAHLEIHSSVTAVGSILAAADLETADEAIFFARHFFVFFGDCHELTPALAALLGHSDWRVRAALAYGIGDHRQQSGDRLVGRIIDTLTKDADYKVRAAVATMISRATWEPYGAPIAALLADENWHVREMLLRGLTTRDEPLGHDELTGITQDETWRRTPAHVGATLQRLYLLSGATTDVSRDERSRALFCLLREIRTGSISLPEKIRNFLLHEAEASTDWLVRRELNSLVGDAAVDVRTRRELFRGLRDKRSVQVALDLPDLHHALTIAEAAVQAGAALVEVGDPLIKRAGIGAIQQVKRCVPDATVVAEMMSADWGRDQVILAAEAGADVVLLIGPASIASVQAAVEASRRFAVPLVLDIPAGRFTQSWVQAMEQTGVDAFAITTNIDLGVAGTHPLDTAEILRSWTRLPIAVSGGFGVADLAVAASTAWDIIVVGRSIAEAVNPMSAARNVIQSLIPSSVSEMSR